jgi:hypothetical protein
MNANELATVNAVRAELAEAASYLLRLANRLEGTRVQWQEVCELPYGEGFRHEHEWAGCKLVVTTGRNGGAGFTVAVEALNG